MINQIYKSIVYCPSEKAWVVHFFHFLEVTKLERMGENERYFVIFDHIVEMLC